MHQELYFGRDTNGNEVDLLLPNVTQFDIFEIKSSQTAMTGQFKGLDYFESLTPEKIASKTVIYGGEENQKRNKGNIKSWYSL